jgi:hypothetical protein
MAGNCGNSWAHNPKVAGSNPAPATKFSAKYAGNLALPEILTPIICSESRAKRETF